MRRVWPRWQAHLRSTWEEIARLHAIRLVAGGEFGDLVIGRWWRDEVVELDVVGIGPDGTAGLFGEAMWQNEPFTAAQLIHLRNGAAASGLSSPNPRYLVWSRSGSSVDVASFPDVRTIVSADLFG